jgi:hypothetical protein
MSGKAIRETLGFLGVIASMVFVGMEIRQNTLALRREAALERAYAMSEPFLTDSELPEILAQIKAVDGMDAGALAFMERYDLSYEQTTVWLRHLLLIWSGMQADYLLEGESPLLGDQITALLGNPDNQLFWELRSPMLSDPGFIAYVERVRPTP